MSRKKTREEWINKFREVHGNKYNYSLMQEPSCNRDKVDIVCDVHGTFSQTVSDHAGGKGCKTCGRKRSGNVRKKSPQQFFEEMKVLHDSYYTYPENDYNGLSNPITIECPVHGRFTQTAYNHAWGKGCRPCADKRNAEVRMKYDTESFKEYCSGLHKGKYDYSKVDYKAATKPVVIGCPIHGDFEQTAQAHYEGHGCPECGIINKRYIGGFGDKIQQWQDSKNTFDPCNLYLFKLSFEGKEDVLKYGITVSEVSKRGAGIKHGAKASSIELLKSWPMPLCTAYAIEQLIKKDFEPYWHRPVKRFDGWTECLEDISEQEVIDYIEELV